MVKGRISDILAKVELLQFANEELEGEFDSLDLEDERLSQRLKSTAALRDLTLDDVRIVARKMHEEDLAQIMHAGERLRQCSCRADDLVLYRVENTAKRSIDILAGSVDCARLHARYAGHVLEETNAKVFRYKEDYVAAAKRSGSAVGRAIREGIPGVLKRVGTAVIIESAGKAYMPMNVVE